MSIEAFPITLRLTKSAQYQAVFNQRHYRIPMGSLLLLARQNQMDRPRIGLILSKRVIPLAVQRNRVKRLLRESFRRHQQDVAGLDIIILARRGLGDLDNKVILNDATVLWKKLVAQRGPTT
ncbi:MAG: ribonuclease P protein component [Gammaproteobacteria bacterium]|nr:ribonuclease P protein component [Gammaproteobacteria bacterium]